MTDYDGTAHISEEIKRASIAAPAAIVRPTRKSVGGSRPRADVGTKVARCDRHGRVRLDSEREADESFDRRLSCLTSPVQIVLVLCSGPLADLPGVGGVSPGPL